MDSAGFMVGQERYNAHLKVAKEIKEVNIYPVNVLRSFIDSCRNGHVMNIKRSTRQTFFSSTFSTEALGVGASCTQHGCWVPHSVVDFQRGEA